MSEQGPPATTLDTLHGWKEIAAYIGKSVRSAQRWERELGLPTHRISTPDGQIVYARRSEIDAWRARMDRQPGGRAAMAAAPDVPAEAPPALAPPSRHERQGLGIGVWLAIGAAVGLSAWGLNQVWSAPAPAALATLQLVGRQLEARDASGQVLWTHQFDSDVDIIKETHIGPSSESLVSASEDDVDGDGSQDYLVAIRSSPNSGDLAGRGDTLYAFSGGGRILWQVSSQRTLVCGGEAYTGPWQLGPVLVFRDEATHRVWVAFKHHTWWPSFVVEVRRDGTQVPRYVQSGWIMALTQWTTPTGKWVVAGGVLNEKAGASIAFLDPDGDEAHLPAGDARFSCDVSSARTPSRVVLFPSFEVPQTEGNAYVIVNQLATIDADLRVEIDASNVTGTVAADGTVRSLEFTDRYWFLHKELERQGRITHAAAACPERHEPKELRYWTPETGWQAQTITLKSR